MTDRSAEPSISLSVGKTTNLSRSSGTIRMVLLNTRYECSCKTIQQFKNSFHSKAKLKIINTQCHGQQYCMCFYEVLVQYNFIFYRYAVSPVRNRGCGSCDVRTHRRSQIWWRHSQRRHGHAPECQWLRNLLSLRQHLSHKYVIEPVRFFRC